MFETLFVSTGIVALAEIGDKTQLLSLVLAARFRRPWPIVAGIFASTLLNHAAAGALGAWITHAVGTGADGEDRRRFVHCDGCVGAHALTSSTKARPPRA